jgi:hydrogenase-4 component F
VAGFLAITGTPPFGLFFSKFIIFKAAFDQGEWVVGVILLLLLAVIFIAMATACLSMAQGRTDSSIVQVTGTRRWLTLVPSMALGAVALGLGIGIPQSLNHLLSMAAQTIGGAL